MSSLNYHHLLYFWTVARTGSIAKASAELELTQPTISEQIHLLEKALARKLFDRVGRSLILTGTGKQVFEYAEKIFSLGQQLTASLESAKPEAVIIRVGIQHGVPHEFLAARFRPAVEQKDNVLLKIEHDSLERLREQLSDGKLDVVFGEGTERPYRNLYLHQLLDCGTAFVTGSRSRSGRFPGILESVPLLLPAQKHQQIEEWVRRRKLLPRIVGEFDSFSFLQTFVQQGLGVFAAPDCKVWNKQKFKVLGRNHDIRWRYFALTRERQPINPLLASVISSGRRKSR